MDPCYFGYLQGPGRYDRAGWAVRAAGERPGQGGGSHLWQEASSQRGFHSSKSLDFIGSLTERYIFVTYDCKQINVARTKRHEQWQQNGFFLMYWHIIYIYDKMNKYFTKNKSCFYIWARAVSDNRLCSSILSYNYFLGLGYCDYKYDYWNWDYDYDHDVYSLY